MYLTDEAQINILKSLTWVKFMIYVTKKTCIRIIINYKYPTLFVVLYINIPIEATWYYLYLITCSNQQFLSLDPSFNRKQLWVATLISLIHQTWGFG